MIIYVILYLMLLILGKIKTKKEDLKYIIPILIFFCCRFNLGADEPIYRLFGEMKELKILPLLRLNLNQIWELAEKYNIDFFYLSSFNRFELGNKLLYRLAWNTNLEGQVIIIVYSVITLYFLKEGVNRVSKNKMYSYLIFIGFPMFMMNFVGILRQSLAVSIIFYAYKYLMEKKILKYIFFVLLASCFHKTAIIGIGIFLIYYVKIHSYLLIYIIVECLLKLYKNLIYIANLPYSNYILNPIYSMGNKIYYFILILFFLLFIVNKINNRVFQKAEKEFQIVMFGLIIYLVFAKFGIIGYRLSLYFIIFILNMTPKVITNLKGQWKNIVKINIIILVFCLMIINLYIDSNNIKGKRLSNYKVFFLEK